jgi:hypothetical protein
MQGHERYEELCALAAIGQVPEEEAEEFQDHLRICEACKDVQGDFGLILDQLPSVVQASPSSTAKIVRQARREQFLCRAEGRGIRFSREAIGGAKLRAEWTTERRLSWYKASFAAAACSLAVIFVLAGAWQYRQRNAKGPLKAAAVVSSEVKTVDVSVPDIRPSTKQSSVVAASNSAQEQIDRLQDELKQMRSERQEREAELVLARRQILELSNNAEGDKRTLEEAKKRVVALESAQADMVSALVEKEQRIRDLSAETTKQNLAAEREQELNAAATDVRELMAARNLHIIDVADVDGRGKARKSFGRVFYVEGQSLLFYAFDLGEIGAPSKVLFQAWGQQEGTTWRPRNLGVFRVDDQAQKRWVLRVDDPKVLASIDSLFVTVEPSPGADQPTGRRLIYAYLNTPANHP